MTGSRPAGFEPFGPAAWLLPAVLGLHVAEEYSAGEGFAAWFSRTFGARYSSDAFVALNTGALLLAVAIAAAAHLGAGRVRLPVLVFATTLFVNGALHTTLGLWQRAYNPGLASAFFGFLPLGAVFGRACYRRLPGAAFAAAAAGGLALHAAVTLTALGAWRAR